MSQPLDGQRSATPRSAVEPLYVASIIVSIAVITTVPYLLGYRGNQTFVGQIFNVPDFCVYLSWARQAADGHFSSWNLFTTVSQHGYLFNVLFLLVGGVVHLTGLPIAIVFQTFRVGGAALLLWVAYKLCAIAYPDLMYARLTSLGLIAFGSGFGFIYKLLHRHGAHGMPIDVAEPESTTFTSIYTTMLFVIALVFILTTIYNLVRGELTGRRIYGVYAGICALILGNFHSYDVLHLVTAWAFYLTAATIAERKFDKERWLRALIAGVIALPSTAYQYWVFKHETVFHLRALSPTLSPSILYYALGYGIVFILAAAAVVMILSKNVAFTNMFRERKVIVWLVSWAVAGLTIIRLPVAFQCKMIMGEHIPLCILSGGAAVYAVRNLSKQVQPFALSLLVLATFPSNLTVLMRDVLFLKQYPSFAVDLGPYLSEPQVETLAWLRQNTKMGDAILATEPLAQFIPGYCDRAVYIGHWSETPFYEDKRAELATMFSSTTPALVRQKLVFSTKAAYLVYPSSDPEYSWDLKAHCPPFLTPVYSTPSGDAVDFSGFQIYKIDRLSGQQK